MSLEPGTRLNHYTLAEAKPKSCPSSQETIRFLALLTIALALLCAIGIAAHGQSKDASSALHARVDTVFADWDSTTSPGCAVAIAKNGQVDYSRGYGMSNLEYDIAITPDSIFHVASISKQFTAFAIALLARDGSLSLDDDIHEYLPELPDYGSPITIRHLVHHTSGLRDQWDLLELAGWRADDVITESDVLRIVTRQRSLNFEPGDEYLYSNTGFTLMAIIVKRISGLSLRDFAEAHIFSPLGMRDTHFHNDHSMIVRRRTSAYQPNGETGWKISIPVFDTDGATSLFTTTRDLLKWEQNFVDARVGGKTLVEEMEKPARLTDGSDTGYAMGLSLGSYRGLRTIGHSGVDAGYRADVVRFPDQELTVVALCNASSSQPSTLTRRVAGLYLSDQMTPLVPPMPLSPEELEVFAGTYWSEATDDTERLVMRDRKLTRAPGFPELVPIGRGRFRVGESATEFQFPNSTPTSMTTSAPSLDIVTPPRRPTRFTRVTDSTDRTVNTQEFVGRFHSDELDVTYSVDVEGDRLVLQSVKHPELPLDLLWGDRFASPLGTVTFERNGSGNVIGMTISMGRARRLQFDRVATSGASSGRS